MSKSSMKVENANASHFDSCRMEKKRAEEKTRNLIRHGDELGGLFSILWSLKSQKRKKNEEKKLLETPGLEPGTSRSEVKCVTDMPKHFP